MTDTYTLQLKNFRSIRDAAIDIAPLTVVYGPNGSGKSSLIYGLLTLRNFLTNPNQNLPSLFSYPTMSLGDLEEVVSGYDVDRRISLSLTASTPAGESKFTLGIDQAGGQAAINAEASGATFVSALDIPFPYHGELSDTREIVTVAGDPPTDTKFDLTWTGISVGESRRGDRANRGRAADLLTTFNLPMELSRTTAFVPLRRGFTNPTYSVTNVTPALASDVEVASLLATDRFLAHQVSDYMEEVSDRRIATHTQVGTPIFTIDSIPRNGGSPVSIVNDGFGVNQVAYMLTVSLHPGSRIVAIEEPETHLHPSLVRKLVHALADIAANHGKRFIVSTHSESFVLALLARIAAGEVEVDDVSFVLAEQEDGESDFSIQEALPNGQLQGGLYSFMSAELVDMGVFLGIEQPAEVW